MELTRVQAEQLICWHATGDMGKGKNRGKVMSALLEAGMIAEHPESGRIYVTKAGADFAINNQAQYNWIHRAPREECPL